MNKRNITVSVFVFAYNHEKFICDCLDGIVMQKTTFDYEVLVQDDASKDLTPKFISEYEKKYSFLTAVYNKENIYSKGGNINEYFYRNAKGKYFAICEGDDYWTDPYKLQKQVEFLVKNPLFSLCYHMVETPGYTNNDGAYLIRGNISTSFIPTCSVVFRNNKRIVNLFLEYSKDVISGDQFLFYLCDFEGEIKFLNFVGGCYNQTEEGISKKIGIRSKKWDTNRVLMYSRLLRIAPLKNKVKLIKIAQGSLFNAMTHGIMKPFMTYPYHVFKIIILAYQFFTNELVYGYEPLSFTQRLF